MAAVEYTVGDAVEVREVTALYQSVGWTVYTDDPERLCKAIDHSSFVATARMDSRLVGLVRAMTDDASVVFIQDLLVATDVQGRGIGHALVSKVLARFAHVPRTVLLTDDEPKQHAFYRTVGFEDVNAVPGLHAFVRF